MSATVNTIRKMQHPPPLLGCPGPGGENPRPVRLVCDIRLLVSRLNIVIVLSVTIYETS